MASSEFWQRVSSSGAFDPDWAAEASAGTSHGPHGSVGFWMVLDGVTILVAALAATFLRMHTNPLASLWRGTLFQGRSAGILLLFLCGFAATLIVISLRMRLYTPLRINSFLHEQRLSVQACFTSGLLLTGTLYLLKAQDISRAVVLITLVLVTVTLSLRRLAYRIFLYRRFDRGIGTRNAFIVGTGPEARALRHHLESIRHLGYSFKGFIDLPGSASSQAVASAEVVGNLATLFHNTRRHFIDEIFFATPCERTIVQGVLDQARIHGVDLRVVPDIYSGQAWHSPIEYIGQFPTIPLHRGYAPESGLFLKRSLDVLFSTVALVFLAPLLALIALAIKLDSPGPVFYLSDRIGKKGRVFRCIKFRSMVRDAEKLRANVLHMNERDGVLFKATNDPRITRLGRFLRKFSIDELPQFLNVLSGNMSVVGPRPPIASEVREYNLSHLRRLDVTPGITGLWQVQGRQDPSFDSYVSLDVTYIENWSLWLDMKIIVRTVGVVLAGTGS